MTDHCPALRPETCGTCHHEGRRGYCAPLRCYCGHDTCPAFGVVLDPFGGTGTTALVASALGRHGISNDLSRDYLRIAAWRTSDPKQIAKAKREPFTPSQEPIDGQLDILSMLEGEAS